MSGQAEGTISTQQYGTCQAICPPLPSHLQGAVEGLSSFGTTLTNPSPQRQGEPEHGDAILIPPVTKTDIAGEGKKAGIA